jgi:2-methylcitrate dehydratase PrpD
MSSNDAFLLSERTAAAIDELADFLGTGSYAVAPQGVRERLPLVLADLLGVTVAGMRTPELGLLVEAWPLPSGAHPVLGTDRTTTPETAALLAATAACSQELDEGNKYAAGHPAAHVVFAAMAAAQQASETGVRVSGERFLAAVAAGYEVAARFGRAVRRNPAWHPHGHWGTTGAACAASVVLGATPAQVAAAIDAATGTMTVAPWATVLAGDFTRNLWMGRANLGGLSAAHLARAGLVVNRGGAAASLGLVGEFEPGMVTADLGERWLVAEGYLKQHSACSYTHAAVDLVQCLRAAGRWGPADVAKVHVGTHSLARPLLQRDPTSRLAAMFSLPFVVSMALVCGSVDPESMEPGSAAFAKAQAFSERVDVEVLDELDAWLPHRRITQVRLDLRDGTRVSLAQPDPIGDTAHFPFGEDDVVDKLDRLLGTGAGSLDGPTAADLLAGVRALAGSDDVVAALADLPLLRGPAPSAVG